MGFLKGSRTPKGPEATFWEPPDGSVLISRGCHRESIWEEAKGPSLPQCFGKPDRRPWRGQRMNEACFMSLLTNQWVQTTHTPRCCLSPSDQMWLTIVTKSSPMKVERGWGTQILRKGHSLPCTHHVHSYSNGCDWNHVAKTARRAGHLLLGTVCRKQAAQGTSERASFSYRHVSFPAEMLTGAREKKHCWASAYVTISTGLPHSRAQTIQKLSLRDSL